MRKLKFNDTIKSKINELKEKTLIEILIHDKHYQTIYTEKDIAEQEYRKLDLTKEQKKVVDKLLSLMDACNTEYGTLNYIAGLYDSQKPLNGLNLFIEKENSQTPILRNFYRSKIFAKELFQESSESKMLCEKFDSKEQKYISSLTEKQHVSYSQLSRIKGKLLDSLLEDQFVCSFKLGAEFMLGILKNKS